MAGFREFVTGEVLTAANVDDFLAKQAVMKFADAAARDTALGTAVASGNALREGMVAWLDDDDSVIAYDGSAWNAVGGGGGFDDVEVITATNATWPVPSLGSPIVKVTVIGGGGAAGTYSAAQAGSGGSSSFDTGVVTVTATGGAGGYGSTNQSNVTPVSTLGLSAGNGGGGAGAPSGDRSISGSGCGGKITVDYLDLTGISTVDVTIGAGGTGASGNGGRGEVIVEYKAA